MALLLFFEYLRALAFAFQKCLMMDSFGETRVLMWEMWLCYLPMGSIDT